VKFFNFFSFYFIFVKIYNLSRVTVVSHGNLQSW